MCVEVFDKADLSSFMEIENESFISPWTEDSVLGELNNPFSTILVYKENGKIIGFIDYWVTFESCQICQVAVLKQYRKRGIATKLFEEMFKRLNKEEVDIITLEVRVHNNAAINAYKKWGFEELMIKANYYDNGDDAIYMIKRVGETYE